MDAKITGELRVLGPIAVVSAVFGDQKPQVNIDWCVAVLDSRLFAYAYRVIWAGILPRACVYIFCIALELVHV